MDLEVEMFDDGNPNGPWGQVKVVANKKDEKPTSLSFMTRSLGAKDWRPEDEVKS